MTCIIGVIDKKNKKVYMGADSCASNGQSKIIRKDMKMFKPECNPNFLVGFTTSYRMGQLLMYGEDDIFPTEEHLSEEKYEINHNYIVADIIPKIQKLFTESGFGTMEEGGEFLLAYKDSLFRIYCDFQVEETALDYNSCGCGEYYAEGSLFALKNSKKDIVNKIHTGLQSATYFSVGVQPPFYIMNTNDDEMITFDK
jgi:ATP-dependent protease HslVU (ClpYQ) peptidase subunit